MAERGGLPWYCIWTEFSRHPKTLALCAALRDDNAGMYVVRLLEHCAEHALDGLVKTSTVEAVAAWRKRRGVLVDALTDAGFIESRPGGVCVVHGWEERNGARIRQWIRDNAKRKPRGSTSTNHPENPALDHQGTTAETPRGFQGQDVRGNTERDEETLSPAQAREGEPELDPVAADTASPPAAEAAAGSTPSPHERTVEKPGEPETIAPASPRPLPTAVDQDTGTALPGAPDEAPGGDPAPPPAGHSAEGGSSSAAAEEPSPPPRPPLGPVTLSELAVERARTYPAAAALLQAADGEGIVLTWPRDPKIMNESATLLGLERSLEILRRGHAKDPSPFSGWYTQDLYRAAQLERRRTREPAAAPPPALDQAWLDSLPPDARAEAERDWPELVARVRHAAYPDEVARLLAEAQQGLMQRFSAGGCQ